MATTLDKEESKYIFVANTCDDEGGGGLWGGKMM